MARLVTSVADAVATMINKRGYAGMAAARMIASRTKTVEKVMKGNKEKGGVDNSDSHSSPSATPWVPDPVTGYYRPGDQLADMDAAQLRETLLSRRD